MTTPIYLDRGSANAGTASVTYDYLSFPSSRSEFLLAVIEDANQGTLPTPTPSGWTLLTGTPVGIGTAGGTSATAVRVYYKFATSSDTPSFTLGDLGDHQVGAILTFSGVDRTNPFDVAAVSDTSASSSSVTFPSITTSTNNSLVVCIVANATDSSVTQGSSPVHSGLSGIIFGGFNSSIGNGGGIDYIIGTKATAGSTGTGTCSLATSSVQARLVLALRADQSSVSSVSKLAAYAVIEPTVTTQVSQVAVEVLRTNLLPTVQVSQVAVEVLRTNLLPTVQVSQVAVEVLRPNLPVITQKPYMFVCT